MNSSFVRAVVVGLLFLMGSSLTFARATTRAFDVREDHVFRVTNVIERVDGVGDFNGDGLSDFVAATYWTEIGKAGVCLVFGKSSAEDVDCRLPGEDGILMHRGSRTGAEYNYFPSNAGDVNNDGLTDVLVLSPRPNPEAVGPQWAWDRIYVIYGTRSPTTVDLDDFDEGTQGTSGFVVKGPDEASLYRPDALGDMNRDGNDDLLIGRTGSDTLAYVVFGSNSVSEVNLQDWESGHQGAHGFAIKEPFVDEGEFQVDVVRRGGDINGDRLTDIVVSGVHFSDDPHFVGPAEGTYVILGKKGSDSVRLGRSGQSAYRIFRRSSWDVEPAGDMNLDGKDDLVTIGGNPRSVATVVFGSAKNRRVDLYHLGGQGFRVTTSSPFGAWPRGVDVAPDMNGDGRPELLMVQKRKERLNLWVVYGRRKSLDLSELGARGFRMYGDSFWGLGGDMYGSSGNDDFVGLRDLTGDDRGEILTRGPRAGVAYVVAGR